MTCTELRERVADLVEAPADVSREDVVERHLAECDACRELVDDLQRIRQTAASLDRPMLPPDVWPRLRQRLETAGVGRPVAGSGQPRRPSWLWLATAAALVLAVGLGVWNVARERLGDDRRATAPQDPRSPGALVQTIESELQLAATHYENAIRGLEQVANASDSPLDPVVMATLRQNLGVIDQAIDESRAALRANPGSQLAQESLFEAFRRKVALLQDTIALMNEMRKGDEAGTARIIEGLNKS